MFWLKAKCSEEITSRQHEVDRLDTLIVHSPERAAQERVIMEEKVSGQGVLVLVIAIASVDVNGCGGIINCNISSSLLVEYY